MPSRDLNIGNTVIPLTAKLNGRDIDDEILEWTPILTDFFGGVITTTYYDVLDAPGGTTGKPYILDIGENAFRRLDESYGLLTANVEFLYDPYEEEFNRKSGNYTKALITSAARSTDAVSNTVLNYNHKGGHFFFTVEAIAVDATITPKITGKDPETGLRYDILVGTTITATGINILKIYPGIGQIPNGSASDILPTQFRVEAEYGGTGTITYSVSCSLIV